MLENIMVHATPYRSWLAGIVMVMVIALIPLALRGQAVRSTKGVSSNRISFDVVQSFDAKYEGDTPGHLGRAGGLDNVRVNVALGDPIHRGDAHIGNVTGLTWNRTNGSLDIEFDPVGKVRVAVGDEVWMAVDGRSARGATSESAK